MKKTWSKVLATVLVLAMVLCMPGFAASVDTVDYDADHAASADELTDADLPELLSASGNRAGVEDLLAKGRVDFMFPADYREGTGLDVTVRNIIRKMAISDALTAENVRQLQAIGHGEVPGQAGLFE